MSRPTGKTVLVVDDESATRSLVTEVIERRGHKVIKAPDGVWAIRTLEEHPEVNLLIMDVRMPRMDGLETVRRLRAGKFASLPVILLTGEAKDGAVVKGYEAGADYYLTKPVKPERLLKIVDFLIGDLSEHARAVLQLQL